MKKYIVSFLILCGVLSAGDCVSNGNGTVTCTDTGLMWQDDNDVMSNNRKWQGAIFYCEDITLLGYTDWRLPNMNELRSITDRINKTSPSLKDGFKKRSTKAFWSSTTYLPYSSTAWGVRFDKGNKFYNEKSIPYFIRCVR